MMCEECGEDVKFLVTNEYKQMVCQECLDYEFEDQNIADMWREAELEYLDNLEKDDEF